MKWSGLSTLMILSVSVYLGCNESNTNPEVPWMKMTDARWASSTDLKIVIHQQDQDSIELTQGNYDFKPSWSKTGSMLTFFRLIKYGSAFHMWKTKLCVINVDGSGFRELSDGSYADFNPTWTRDGTNMVLFNRYAKDDPSNNLIYMISPTGDIGDEILLSHPDHSFEWVFCGLKDGRLFVDWVDFFTDPKPTVRSYLLKPKPKEIGEYEEIIRPTEKMWHKLSVSPDETKVAYMLDNDDDMSTYEDVVLYFADFVMGDDLVVKNPVAITKYDPGCIVEYPRWSPDGDLILYDSNCSGRYQIYAYRLLDGITGRLTDNPNVDYQFGNFENVPK